MTIDHTSPLQTDSRDRRTDR